MFAHRAGHGRRTGVSSLTLGLPLALAALLAAAEARAEEAEPVLGRPGQVVLPELVGLRSGVPAHYFGSSVGLVLSDVGWGGIIGYSRGQQSQQVFVEGGGLTTRVSDSESFWVAPAVDIFVSRRISIGVGVGVLWNQQRFVSDSTIDDARSFSVGMNPRIGYLVPMGHGLSFWPRLGVGFSYSESSAVQASYGQTQASISRAVTGIADLALVYHPAPHLLFKVAPQIAVGRTATDGGSSFAQGWSEARSGEGLWVRVGGEATAGLVF